MDNRYWVNYSLNDNKKWELSPCFDPNNLRRDIKDLPDPANISHREQEIVFLKKDGLLKTCVIQGIFCQYVFSLPEKGWIVYYDLKWEGTGHTHGWFREDEFMNKGN